MNKTIGIVIVIIVILIGGYFLMRAPDTSDTNNTVNVNTTEEERSTALQGRAVFSVTDAAANMSAISDINIKVDTAEVKSTTGGWTTLSFSPKTYSLLMLNSNEESELLADMNLDEGTYNQIRLGISEVTVIMKDGTTKDAKLPSGELKINTKLVVKQGSTSSVNFDFLADKSLHTTGKGEYIFAPVVKTEAKSDATVSIDAENVVKISGGNTDDSNTAGMDIDGSVKLNFQIDGKQKLDLDADNQIKLRTP